MTAHRRLGFNRVEFRKRLRWESWERSDNAPRLRIKRPGYTSTVSLGVWIRFYWFNHLRYMYPIGEIGNPAFDYTAFKRAMRSIILDIKLQPKPRLP